MTKYMVIETFFEGCLDKVYERFHEKGRMIPEGLHYIDSWLEKDGSRCYQLMETENVDLIFRVDGKMDRPHGVRNNRNWIKAGIE